MRFPTMWYVRPAKPHRVDSRIFPEGAKSPLVFPKGGQPANQMGNGVLLKK